MNYRKLIAHAAIVVLVLVVAMTPIAQRILVASLIEFVEITEQIVRFPYWLIDHTRCFSLDRFDPTCPQCL